MRPDRSGLFHDIALPKLVPRLLVIIFAAITWLNLSQDFIFLCRCSSSVLNLTRLYTSYLTIVQDISDFEDEEKHHFEHLCNKGVLFWRALPSFRVCFWGGLLLDHVHLLWCSLHSSLSYHFLIPFSESTRNVLLQEERLMCHLLRRKTTWLMKPQLCCAAHWVSQPFLKLTICFMQRSNRHRQGQMHDMTMMQWNNSTRFSCETTKPYIWRHMSSRMTCQWCNDLWLDGRIVWPIAHWSEHSLQPLLSTPSTQFSDENVNIAQHQETSVALSRSGPLLNTPGARSWATLSWAVWLRTTGAVTAMLRRYKYKLVTSLFWGCSKSMFSKTVTWMLATPELKVWWTRVLHHRQLCNIKVVKALAIHPISWFWFLQPISWSWFLQFPFLVSAPCFWATLPHDLKTSRCQWANCVSCQRVVYYHGWRSCRAWFSPSNLLFITKQFKSNNHSKTCVLYGSKLKLPGWGSQQILSNSSGWGLVIFLWSQKVGGATPGLYPSHVARLVGPVAQLAWWPGWPGGPVARLARLARLARWPGGPVGRAGH